MVTGAFELKDVIEDQYENEVEIKKRLGHGMIGDYMRQYYEIRNVIDELANDLQVDNLRWLQEEIRLFGQKGMLALVDGTFEGRGKYNFVFKAVMGTYEDNEFEKEYLEPDFQKRKGRSLWDYTQDFFEIGDCEYGREKENIGIEIWNRWKEYE